MSDYKDVVKTAIEKGFPLDACGTDERYYSWGLYTDLCGMSVEDAKEAGGGGGGGGSDTKKKNVITFAMQNKGDGTYTLVLSATYEPTANVSISFSIDGAQQNVTLPAGQKALVTDISGANPNYPYAEITSISVTSTDESYTYSSKNNVKNGVFTLTIIKDGVKTTQNVKCGDVVSLDTPEPREGYNFVWRDQSGNVIENNVFTMTDGNTQITGTYEVISYILHYIINEQYFDGDELKTRLFSEHELDVNYGTRIRTVLPNTTYAGYENLQWTYNGEPVGTDTTMPASDITAESIYNLSTFILTFKVDGADYDVQSLKYTQPVVLPDDPSKIGYEFLNWDTTISTMPAENVVINAVFSAINYTIEYYINGDKVTAYTENHIYGDAITIRQDEYNEGYQFSGWNSSIVPFPATMPAENIIVTATSVAIDYVLSFVADGVTVHEETYNFGDTVSVQGLDDPVKEGYNFTGWNPEIPATMPSHDVECVAEFAIKQMTIKYYVDGQLYSSTTYNYGDSITAITEPTKIGHAFAGWDETIPAIATEGTLEVNATFTVNTYTITYVVDGVSTEVEYLYGANVVPAQAPTKRGYTFTGWDYEEPQTMPAQNLVLTAQFTVNSYTITWIVDGITKYVDTYNYGDNVTARPDETKTGYSFSGWDTQVPAIMDDNNYTVNGTFTINQYTLSFILDGEPYTSITEDYGTAIAAPIPQKEGYTFNGWNAQVPATMPAQDMTFSGTTTVNQYTATYIIDGQTYTSITYNYGATINYPIVEKDGYRAVWIEEYQTMPASNIVIAGTYEEIQSKVTIYYGSVPESEVPTFSNFSSLTILEYTFGNLSEMNFVVPASPEYNWAASELDDDEFEQWMEDHMYDFYIMVPDDGTVASITIENAIGIDVTDTFLTLPNDVVYGGTNYKVYYRRNQTQLGTDTNMEMAISMEKGSGVQSYEATYYIDGALYTSITYNVGATILYPDVPRQGYVLKWTKTYLVMPQMDITINGTYEEEAQSITVYCGPVIVSELSSFTNYSALTEVTCNYNEETNLTITVDANPEYTEAEEEYTEEEFNAWLAAHMYYYYILVPNDSGNTYQFKNAAGAIIDSTIYPLSGTVTIDGVEYTKLHKEYAAQDDTVQTGTIKIIPSKK